MGRSDGKKFVLSKDVRVQKVIGLSTAGLLLFLPALLGIWSDLRVFQKLSCIGVAGAYAWMVIVDWPRLSTVFIIEDRQIKSRRWGKVLCEVRCTGIKNQLFRKIFISSSLKEKEPNGVNSRNCCGRCERSELRDHVRTRLRGSCG